MRSSERHRSTILRPRRPLRRRQFRRSGFTAARIKPAATAPTADRGKHAGDGGEPSSRACPRRADTAVMAARDAARSAASLDELRAILRSFRGLRVCGRPRRNSCSPTAIRRRRVMFVGEAPGRDEDLAGLPFVGRSGKLLDRMLAAIGLDRTTRLYRQHHSVAPARQSHADPAGKSDLPAVHPAADRARRPGHAGVPRRAFVAGACSDSRTAFGEPAAAG